MRHYDVMQVTGKGTFRFLSVLPENFQNYNSGSGVYLVGPHESSDPECHAPWASDGSNSSSGDES